MNLYVMHKREVLLTLIGFLSGFILFVFIGLAGPNTTKLDKLTAIGIFKKDEINNTSVQQNLLTSGPFLFTIPRISSYSAHLCLWITFFIEGNEDSVSFQKRFLIAIKIKGIANNQTFSILEENFEQNKAQFHHLICDENRCEPIKALHLENFEYSKYEIEIRFDNLQHFNSKNHITNIHFTFQYINPFFTTLTIWFRFIFLMITFIVTVSLVM